MLICQQDATIAYYAGYTEDEIEPVVHLMVDYLARPVIHEAFFKKYASKKFMKGKFSSASRSRYTTDKQHSLHSCSPMGKEERCSLWHHRY